MTAPDWPYRFDKSTLTIHSLGHEPCDRDYWLSRPVEERFAAVEFLRQQYYGYDPTTTRLQRVIKILPLRGS